MVNSGYTLPVFATASAVAALQYLQNNYQNNQVEIDLIKPSEIATIKVEQIAKISDNQALAITKSNPGDNLDLTRDTPIWAIVTLTLNHETKLKINGGEGVGKIVNLEGKSAIYSYAQKLLEKNLLDNLNITAIVDVEIILPEGKRLAQKTSNSAFGVIEGLSLLGTTGISQPLTSKKQLDLYQEELFNKAEKFDNLVFCIGENGLDLALKLGFNSEQLIKTANWLGSMLVSASVAQIKSVILLGYHGKLIKLAGNIFHTHHHLADGRLEILTAIGAYLELPNTIIKQIFIAETTESALQILRNFDQENKTNFTKEIYQFIANRIEDNAQKYIQKHSDFTVKIGTILFERNRNIIAIGNNGKLMINNQDIFSLNC
ncbi:MAG: cobalt-precorrin-5B (C(1))-methyltransferase [Cyanobacteria bacterium]|nr:cobalt-precorrin-5B (C(1))-methyltransferase [Cyanobacteria bacterium CG_2015-16_32_12]NCO79062.1 cobalt-precorrin-5B (C(1))-methyltransferase [Cyanobacteria bacterium CG_2015-22_32_23]NCQ05222.1 cobalt-precorrin-5B (C(1))-methyltransferase [Cyanobacteria bacterium CG_2015-09_32_10]NCQ42392.1 cobalt-precorrin-5B (C(1))-methyltransferase [Cyanobacteria bacterium CG_2015-04_32_10]NCS86012.1 cobalt-precorrin-5B (C(1))-methyltransferase [Cyanobacteria bacterium CG_2015-02_32_10]